MIVVDHRHTIQTLQSKNKVKGISIYLILVFFLVGSLISLPYIHLDITSQSRAIIRSSIANTTVVVGASGRIEKNYLENNKSFFKGDTLAVVTKEQLFSSQKLNDSLLSATQVYLRDINKLLNKEYAKLTTTAGQKLYNSYRARNRELYDAYSFAKKQFDRQKGLFDKQVIAQATFDQYIFELDRAKNALRAFKTQQIASWELTKRELEERFQNLSNTSENIILQEKEYVITTPITGIVQNYQGVTKGSLVNQGQAIAVITPTQDLIVESTVQPSDIGLIKIGQAVRYEFDAFNYNQWGFLQGSIIDIDKNITLSDSGAFFKVRCSLPKTSLSLKNGYEANVTQGMTLTTRYFIVRRSLYDLLFDKVDDWFNPKIIN